MQYSYEDKALKPHIIFRKIVNQPKFFIKFVKCAMANSLGLCAHLLRFCDEKPSRPQEWIRTIEKLISDEKDSTQDKIEWWMGHVLYNMLKLDSNGNYEMDDFIASLFEHSEEKRQGFFNKAYFPNGFHSNGAYWEDSNDRVVAKRFSDFAVKQAEYGHTKFSETIEEFANQLIKRI